MTKRLITILTPTLWQLMGRFTLKNIKNPLRDIPSAKTKEIGKKVALHIRYIMNVHQDTQHTTSSLFGCMFLMCN